VGREPAPARRAAMTKAEAPKEPAWAGNRDRWSLTGAGAVDRGWGRGPVAAAAF